MSYKYSTYRLHFLAFHQKTCWADHLALFGKVEKDKLLTLNYINLLDKMLFSVDLLRSCVNIRVNNTDRFANDRQVCKKV